MSGSSLGNGYLLAVLNGTQEMKMSPAPLPNYGDIKNGVGFFYKESLKRQ